MKKRLSHLVGRGRSNPHLPVESGANDIESSSCPPSRNGSRTRLPGLVPKFIDKVTNRSARSAGQSPNPGPAAASSSAQDLLPAQTSQDPSPLTAPTPETTPDQASNSAISKADPPPDPELVKATLTDAKAGFEGITNVSGMVQNIVSASDNLQSVPDTMDTFSAILGPLKVFNDVANGLADLHPYAKVALSMFTCASKMILAQADRDVAVSRLLTKVSEVYTFMMEDEALAKIESMLAIYGKIARQALECADFITHYSETKSAWKRLGKHIASEADASIQSYGEALDGLMQQFRDQVIRDTVIILHRAGEDLDLSGMDCAAGAGFNTSKCCLPGTREGILSDIKSWIYSTGKDVPPVFWLSGTAGKGKSAIAHTIANWSNEQGGLGACFCFDRTRVADRRHEKIFTTIARDLADCDPTMRRALARAVHDRNDLRHTTDIARQWQELIVGPISMASKDIATPVLVVIEALDESGEANSRDQIICLLAGKLDTSSLQLTEIPANFRVLITSRPLDDIHTILHAVPHVRHVSLDDIASASTERDIQLYISTRLKDLSDVFNDGHFKTLAQKSDGMFEWARLASEYIKSTNIVSRGPMRRFRELSETSAKGARLLDEMYQRILADIMPEYMHEEAIPIFCSVMGQILASSEPLPMAALNTMRQHFPCDDDQYDVKLLMGHLGSLVTGASDSHIPIRPLHASFYDFLTDKSRSGKFFVDASSVQRDLAFSSLRVMEAGLRFNICSLESSYLPNSAVPDLEKRVKDSIPTALSYSCRFWGTHVAATSFQPSLAEEIEAFFDGERLLWWLEALSLMKSLGGSVGCLSSITNWFTGHAEWMHISDAARDTLRFVRTFAPTILHSTPHLYLSALPFAPTQSKIFGKFAAKFPCTPRIVAGHVVKWPQMEKILHGRSQVFSVAMSPDGKRIACGSFDGTIQVWDMETGEASGAPFQGHTRRVASVAFSPDGKRIVSGSRDKTVRVWDAATGKALGAPLVGHTDWVEAVAISLDGNRIISGSCDKTIRVWDAENGNPLGPPLEGHTSYVCSVAISPDGKRIVSGSGDETIRVWDMWTGEALGVPLRGHTASICFVVISPNGKHIMSGSDDNTIRIWDLETGEAFGAPLRGHTGSVQSIAISSDGSHIVSGSYDQTIRVWDAETGEVLGSPLQGHTSSVMSVAISPDGNRIVSGSDDKTIRVWDAETSTAEALGGALQGHTDSVNSVAISPDGHRIVSGSSDMTVRMWDMETGKELGASLQGHTQSVQAVSISSDGHRVVSGSNHGTIRVWNVETGQASGVPLQDGMGFSCVTISLDGRCVATADPFESRIGVWDTETCKASGHPLQANNGSWDYIQSVAISPDAKRIVSGSSDHTVQVWDLQTGKGLGAPLRGHTDEVCALSISPDGKYIMSGSRDKTIRVWDMETRKTLSTLLQGHTGPVRTVAMSPDGKHIVSGSDDRTVRVWDMETGESLASLLGHTGTVRTIAISPDSKHIVSGSHDTTIRVWNLEFLTQHRPIEAPAICFSPNPTHALHSPSSFLQDSSASASLATNEEGWVVGPDGRLLLCIPLVFHPTMYTPGTMLVISNHASQLDLSCFAHGRSWHKCRKQKVTLSS